MIRKIVCIQMNGEFPDFTHRLVLPDYGLPLVGLTPLQLPVPWSRKITCVPPKLDLRPISAADSVAS